MTPAIVRLIENALSEDIGSGDITTLCTVPADHRSEGTILAKSDTVVAGLPLAPIVLEAAGGDAALEVLADDGTRVKAGEVIARLSGSTRTLLAAERVILNLMQRLSGIAALTGLYVDAVSGLPVKILDTRKTTPGLRALEKYAVRVGGGHNHRFGLFDAVLIKDNHIAACGGVAEAIRRAKACAPHMLKIEVEVATLDQLREALDCGADVIMLDNMSPETMREAAKITAGRVPLEASGNVTLSTARTIAETGVNYISAGSLTHSAPAADISMKIRRMA
ncbi:MAG: carboxylating nicotinate-nucleotide diphosphorylase [Nitrospirae bacterium]|nr:carboxylating nicotinate-nucleotide diphosphorylase [Nitrospirota bacterium]